MYTGSIQSPLVSVIVINFNYGRFLEQCLLSILGQTYPFIECIVFDNASTDNSRAVLDSFRENGAFAVAGRSLEIIASDRNFYQTPAAAEAFKRSSGPYVIFFDPDDIMLPTCVEAHVRALLSLRRPVGASCVDHLISTGDHLTASSAPGFAQGMIAAAQPAAAPSRHVDLPPTGKEKDLDLKISELHLVDRQCVDWPWSSTCGLCFRRELVTMLFSRPPQIKVQLDAYLIIGANSLSGRVLIDRPLAIYRHHGKNVFADGSNVANFNFYDRSKFKHECFETATELIRTFTFVADYLARYLWKNSFFIEAVETVADWGMLEPKLPVGSFRLSYLLENEDALVAAFGGSEVNSWILEATTGRRDSLFVKKYRGLTSNNGCGTGLRRAAGVIVSDPASLCPTVINDPAR